MKSRIVSVLVSLLIIAFSVLDCTVCVSADEVGLKAGDTVEVTFSIGAAENVSGASAEVIYNQNLLQPSDSKTYGVDGFVNTNNAGEVRWNFLVYEGMSFHGEKVVSVYFDVLQDCKMKDLRLGYRCNELFDTSTRPIAEDLNNLVITRLVYKDKEYPVGVIIVSSDGSKTLSEVPEQEPTSSTQNVGGDTSSKSESKEEPKPESKKEENLTSETQSSKDNTSSKADDKVSGSSSGTVVVDAGGQKPIGVVSDPLKAESKQDTESVETSDDKSKEKNIIVGVLMAVAIAICVLKRD